MSVTGNFFTKLRGLALTLEKETAQLEQVFGQEDNDYEEESPMRVLHDLRSEITGMKSDIQASIGKNEKKGEELNHFIKICKVLQQRNAADIQQIRDTFQKYGYAPLNGETPEHAEPAEVEKSESAKDQSSDNVPRDVPPPPPTIEKPATWDLLRAPQLSDFGLSHYQLPAVWEPQHNKNAPEEKPKPLYKDIRSINAAKTPKCALRMEEDFSQIQHFGISDYNTNLNDDYTMALMNKKKGSGSEKPRELPRNLLATPAHVTYRNDGVDSPLPPVFCTPGLKVHRKVGLDEKCDENGTEDGSSAEDLSSHHADDCHSLRSSADTLDSPRPPAFCTPGLKVHKKDESYMHPETLESEEPSVVKNIDTPPLPSFETKWLKSDTINPLDITEPIVRPELSHNAHLKEAAPLVLGSDNYENLTKTSSPPKMRDFCIGTPPRPEMTSCLTEDLFKHNLKLASPPKVSEYENLLWTPTRPEMTSCITEDISQILSQYCSKQTKPSWQNTSENKENRP